MQIKSEQFVVRNAVGSTSKATRIFVELSEGEAPLSESPELQRSRAELERINRMAAQLLTPGATFRLNKPPVLRITPVDGPRLAAFASRAFSPRDVKEIVIPGLADAGAEYVDAIATGDQRLAWRRYRWHVFRVFVAALWCAVLRVLVPLKRRS